MSERKEPLNPGQTTSALNEAQEGAREDPEASDEETTPSDPQGERRVRIEIEQSASRNTDLLNELRKTEESISLLNHNEIKRTQNEKRLKEQNKEVLVAAAGVRTHLTRHERYRDSFGKKLVYTLSKRRSVFEAKASDYEKAYHEAVEKRHKAESALEELKADKAALEAEQKSLGAVAERHFAAHLAIDTLYSTIFDGPTPGFPKEDKQESKHTTAKDTHLAKTEALKEAVKGTKSVQAIKTALRHAALEETGASLEADSSLGSLTTVNARLMRCTQYIDRAMNLGEDAFKCITVGLEGEPEASNLLAAKINMEDHLRAVKAAIPPRIVSRSTAAAITSRVSNHIRQAAEAQKVYLEEAAGATAAQRQAIKTTARSLEDERQSLQQLRQGAFESTVGFGEAAPAYNECCDRAEWFEQESDVRCASVVEPEIEQLPEFVQPPEYMEDESGQVEPQASSPQGDGEEGSHSQPEAALGETQAQSDPKSGAQTAPEFTEAATTTKTAASENGHVPLMQRQATF